MRYYRIALIAHPTYSDDDPVWTCYEELVAAGHAVEIVDPARFPDVVDATGAPDETALKAFRQRFRPDYISKGGESASQILAKLEDSGKGSLEPAKRFVVFGYVGPNNFGDELIFSLICDELAERYPESYVSLIGHDPQATLRRHGVVAVTNEMKFEADVLLNGASALVFMAGIMFDDPFESWTAGPIDPFLNPRSEIGGQAAFTLMAAARGVPSVFLGIGAGPLSNPDAQRLVRLEALNGAQYLPRDATTEQLLLDTGVPSASIERKADLAFLVDSQRYRGAAEGRLKALGVQCGSYVAVALRDHHTVPAEFVSQMAEALDQLWEQQGLRTLFMDFAPEDEEIHRHVRDAMKHGAEAVLFGLTYDASETIDALSSAKLVFGMRLHCSIVANVCGVPSVGLDYNEKVNAYYRLMNQERNLLPLNASSADLLEVAENVLASYDAAREELGAMTAANKLLAKEAFDKLDDIVRAHPTAYARRIVYPRTVSPEELALHACQEELRVANAQLEAAREELAEIKHSTTWKVGATLTALPRKIKDRLRN